MDYCGPSMIESTARVVATEGSSVWLEPEQGGSCGSCASSSACGTKGIGTAASKLEQRRFLISNEDKLEVGERVVVGIRENMLLKAAVTAYALPLAVMLLAGALAQWRIGDDIASLVAMIAGLAIGLGISRAVARRLQARGDLAPRYLRRARPGETCNS